MTARTEEIAGSTELERLAARSRLLGANRAVVLRGGGNTSSKTLERDHLGRERPVLRIKASGADLATARPEDFTGLYLDELLPLRERAAMTDEEMVAYLARCVVEPGSRRPSIETLLHAFLPAPHVDHVHADAICTLTNNPRAEQVVREALGEDVAVVPYLRPGFELSRRVAGVAEGRAVVLVHHGLVAWGGTHEEAYGRHEQSVPPGFSMLDPLPKVALVPGLGCVAAARDAASARLRAEIAAHTHAVAAEVLDVFGEIEWLDEEELFDIEYWPLELYKLSLAPPAPELAGTIAIVTGAASGIGREVAQDLARRGAHVVLADLDGGGLAETAAAIEPSRVVRVEGDVTEEAVADEIVR